MSLPLFVLDPEAEGSLQDQIARRIAAAAASGALASGARLPSSRSLARQLGVSRKTVVLAYQKLIDEGFLASRRGSGVFVHRELMLPAAIGARAASTPGSSRTDTGQGWYERTPSPRARALPNWLQYPYPFIDGLFDPGLFPVPEWRATCRSALLLTRIQRWASDHGDADDPALVEEIRSKILLARGIHARSDEILITAGIEHSRFLACSLLVDRSVAVTLEDPGPPDLTELMLSRNARVQYQPVDDDGMVIDDTLAASRVIMLSPGHQIPTGAALAPWRLAALLDLARSHGTFLIEDDSACDMSYGQPLTPALRALAQDSPVGEQVIHVGALPRLLLPSLQIGFIVGPASFISRARYLRRLTVRHPPRFNQCLVALFLSQGHYDAALARLRRTLRRRMRSLCDALDYYLPDWVEIASRPTGTTCWLRGPERMNAATLAAEAEKAGVLIDRIDTYFHAQPAPPNLFRLSVTGLPTERIRSGVAALYKIINWATEPTHDPQQLLAMRLSGRQLRKAIAGTVAVYKSFQGAPCTIEIQRNGTLVGRIGYANEDVDTGAWRIEGDRWIRKWSNWAYGEEAAMHVCIDGERITWVSLAGRPLGTAVLRRTQ